MGRKTANAYAVLCAWLSKADEHYIAGRLLCRSGASFVGAGILWLAVEQLAKVLVIQKLIPSLPLPERSPKRRKDDITDLHHPFDKEAKKICRNHKAAEIKASVQKHYPRLDLASHAIVSKLEKLYFMRYPHEGPCDFSVNDVAEVDALYFCLRNQIMLDVGMGVLDTLCLLRANGKLEYGTLAQLDLFEENTAIGPRPNCSSHEKFAMGWSGAGMTGCETLRFPRDV